MNKIIKKNKSIDLSIVLPCFNEEKSIFQVYEKIKKILLSMSVNFEVIFVDDGSGDKTFDSLRKIFQLDKNVRILKFSRNFGHQMALLAGINHSEGEYIMMMDSDLQHPPELMPELYNEILNEYDIVYTIRKNDKIGFFKKTSSVLFYKIFTFLANVELNPNCADFRIISRRVAENLDKINERDLFLRGYFSWMGFKQKGIEFTASERCGGKSKYSIFRMFSFFITGITSFSVVPLRISLIFCAISLFVAFVYSFYSLYVWYCDIVVPGWTSIIILISFLFSGVFIVLGIIAEYIAKIHIESKSRPHYIIDKIISDK